MEAITCDECDGLGYITCPECGGDGFGGYDVIGDNNEGEDVVVEYECDECEGSGEAVCDVCYGEGTVADE